jgi:hypothetical protein
MLFATPDFGAGAAVYFSGVALWLTLRLFCCVGIVAGIVLCRRTSKKSTRAIGVTLIVDSCFLLVVCWYAPSYLFCRTYGSFPLDIWPNEIREGMSTAEVEAICGRPPHERRMRNNNEHWVYYMDPYSAGWCAIDFGPDGRVTNRYGN